jgi:hypothetical protein
VSLEVLRVVNIKIAVSILPPSSRHKTFINPSKMKGRLLYLKTQFIPCSKHFSIIKTNQFMSYGAEVAVCSEINTKPINTVWAECIILSC